MKKLSETYKELGIAFSFPIRIRDANGKDTYYENSNGYWDKWEYDADGNVTYFENGTGYWVKWEYDANGKVTYRENSRGDKSGTPRTMKLLSDTPRTDAAYHSADYEYVVTEDEAWAFARKLERELNELKCLKANNWHEAADNWVALSLKEVRGL
jgi:YD repeat-containing protein